MLSICYIFIFKPQRGSCVFNAVFYKDTILFSSDKKKEKLINFTNSLNALLREHDYRLETSNALQLYSVNEGFLGILEDRYNCISILEDEYSDIEIYTSPTKDRN